MLGVSLVTTPANGNPLERAKEVRNELQFIKEQKDDDERASFDDMFL